MRERIKKNIRNIFGVAIGGLFLYLTLRKKPLAPVWESLANSNCFFILLSFLCLYAVFYLRALRWKLLIEESGQNPGTNKVLTSVLLGYFVNSFTPKFGEIVRCTSLQESSKTPASVSMGSMMAERAYDLLVLVLGILAIFWIEIDRLKGVVGDLTANGIPHVHGYRYIYALPVLFVLFATLFLLSLKKTRKSKNQGVNKTHRFLKSMFKSLKHGMMLKKRGRFIVLTLLIWIMLATLNYIYLLCLPETSGYPLPFAVVVLFVGGLGWALPSPGGIGTTHLLLLKLFEAYQLDPNAGISFGILSNGLTFIGTLVFGAYGYLRYRSEIKKETPR